MTSIKSDNDKLSFPSRSRITMMEKSIIGKFINNGKIFPTKIPAKAFPLQYNRETIEDKKIIKIDNIKLLLNT